jgi:two-component system response regulator ResD
MQTTKPRILFVDDNDDTRFMVTQLLGRSDYEVLTTDCVVSALTLAKQEVFDLYLLDNRFPDGTGRDLCEKIREFDHDTPIIFYSGDAYEADKQRALSCGAQAYVTKPDIEGLPKAIARVMQAAA